MCIYSYSILGTAVSYSVNVIDGLLTVHWNCLSTNFPVAFLILVPSKPFEQDPSGFSDTGLPNSKFVKAVFVFGLVQNCYPKINVFSKFQNFFRYQTF